jgi:hypothetical protein
MLLGELLVAEGLVSQAAMDDALDAQVVHGGRLGTNLLELGLISEQDLARGLGKQHRMPFAAGAMVPDPAALRLLPTRFCDHHDVIPMRVDGNRLVLACIHPSEVQVFDDIGFRTGKRVVPVLIPEFRMHQLLRRHCGAFRSVRAVDLEVARTAHAKQRTPGPHPPAHDLIGEEEFQKLYAEAMSGRAGDGGEEEEEVLEGVIVEEPEPGPAVRALGSALKELAGLADPAPPAPGSVETGPLTFSEAQRQLALSSDREDVARTVLRFAQSKWRRALLLEVNGPLVVGWHGVGDGVREDSLQRLGVSLRTQSTFKLVCDTRSHYVGPIKRDEVSAAFYATLGGDYPQTAVLLPLLVRGRVVHLLYLDDGPRKLTPPDIGELLILSQSVGRSYEQLMRRQRLH